MSEILPILRVSKEFCTPLNEVMKMSWLSVLKANAYLDMLATNEKAANMMDLLELEGSANK